VLYNALQLRYANYWDIAVKFPPLDAKGNTNQSVRGKVNNEK